MGRALRYPEFDALPRSGSVLYVLQASNGLIKVGMTAHACTRMTAHRRDLERAGLRLERHATAVVGGRLFLLERELIARLDKLARLRAGTNEWFEGVSWGAANTLLRQIAHRQIFNL